MSLDQSLAQQKGCTFHSAFPFLSTSDWKIKQNSAKQRNQRERSSKNMCSKSSPIRQRKSARKVVASPAKSARKTRTKTRKPKYLSLKLQLSASKKPQTQPKPTKMPHKQQLNLFPLHPENLVHDKDFHDSDQVSDHVAFLFETATDTSTSLHGILDSTTTTTSENGPLSPSLTYVYRGHDGEEKGAVSSLVKTAMKCKEREASEERWVSYCELVEKKEQEEVSSCYAAADTLEKMVQAQGDCKKGLVGLKLDYQEIMNVWSDKSSPYIKGESPQIVPDLHEDSKVIFLISSNDFPVIIFILNDYNYHM